MKIDKRFINRYEQCRLRKDEWARLVLDVFATDLDCYPYDHDKPQPK